MCVYIYIHTHIHIYTYIYICMCICTWDHMFYWRLGGVYCQREMLNLGCLGGWSRLRFLYVYIYIYIFITLYYGCFMLNTFIYIHTYKNLFISFIYVFMGVALSTSSAVQIDSSSCEVCHQSAWHRGVPEGAAQGARPRRSGPLR